MGRLQRLMAEAGVQPTEVTFAILTRLFSAAGLEGRAQDLQQLRGTLSVLEGGKWPL